MHHGASRKFVYITKAREELHTVLALDALWLRLDLLLSASGPLVIPLWIEAVSAAWRCCWQRAESCRHACSVLTGEERHKYGQ